MRSLLPVLSREKKRSGAVRFALACGAIGAALASCGSPPRESDEARLKAESEVRSVLREQAAAWNRADLEAFMALYWRSPHLVFSTREGSTRGHAETLARYRRSYDRPEKFGTLAFENLEVEHLDEETAVVIGGWRLKRAADEPRGRFVIVLRRFAEGWRVVADYTTSAPIPEGVPSENEAPPKVPR